MNWSTMQARIKTLLDTKTQGATAYDYWRAIQRFEFQRAPDLEWLVFKTAQWKKAGIGNATIAQRYAAVKWILKHFPREFEPIDVREMLTYMSGIKPDEHEMEVATPEEAEHIISVSAPREALAIGMAYYGGLRLGEIAKSKLSHWQTDDSTGGLSLVIPSDTGIGERTKTGRTRRIPVLPQLESLFYAYVDGERAERIASSGIDTDDLLLTQRGRVAGITKRRLGGLIEEACHACGYSHLHPHAFRHGLATILARKTKDIKLIQSVLGHKNVSSTMRYIHMTQKEIADSMQAAFA